MNMLEMRTPFALVWRPQHDDVPLETIESRPSKRVRTGLDRCSVGKSISRPESEQKQIHLCNSRIMNGCIVALRAVMVSLGPCNGV